LTYDNGDVYKGEWQQSKWHGNGEWTTKSGDQYIGQFVSGLYHGHGEFKWNKGKGGSYLGSYHKGLKAGSGVRLFSNGTQYKGDFVEDQMCGEGVLQEINGDTYVGNFKDNQMNGSGVKTFAHGDRYEGQFMDGMFYGRGKYHYQDGSYYDGEYLATYLHKGTNVVYPMTNGQKHGYGVRVWSDGGRYEGKWVDDKPEGFGFYSNAAKAIRFEGSFWAGKRYGHGVEINAQGTYEGQWQDGHMHGEGTFTKTDGRYYKGEWFRGTKHGWGKQTLVPTDEVGGGADRYFIGGFDYMYRGAYYEGMFEHNARTGHGTLYFTNGHFQKGTFCKGKLISKQTEEERHAHVAAVDAFDDVFG